MNQVSRGGVLNFLLLLTACQGGGDPDSGSVDAHGDVPFDVLVVDARSDASDAAGELPSISGPDAVAQGTCARVDVERAASVDSDDVLLFGDATCIGDGVASLADPGSAVFVRGDDVVDATLTASNGWGEANHRMQIVSAPIDYTTRVLVVHNENVASDAELATAYADARGIDASRICGARFPPGMYANPAELLGARDHILTSCLCPLAEISGCSASDAERVAELAPATHLVLMPGVPLRLTGTPWPADFEEPPLGLYLSWSLAHDDDVFASSPNGSVVVDYPGAAPRLEAIAPIQPSTAGAYAYGHFAAANPERTLALLERTMAAEARGFAGRVIATQHSPTISEMERYFVDRFAMFDPSCRDYITHEPFVFGSVESSWPWESCPAGTTTIRAAGGVTGEYPGEATSPIPYAVGVQLYMGMMAGPNSQAGFDGYDTMLRWRRTSPDCIAECADHATEAERQACRDASLDMFSELDTDCVGFDEGGMGFQLRSFPVEYVGFWPTGWQPMSGNFEKTVPRVLEHPVMVGVTNAHYVRFGADAPPSLCESRTGAVACDERIAVNLTHTIELSPPLDVSGTRELELRFRVRNAGGPRGTLYGGAVLDSTAGGHSDGETVSLQTPQRTWGARTLQIEAREAELGAPNLARINLQIRSFLWGAAVGYVDLDDVELIDVETGRNLLAPDIGGFEVSPHRQTVPGDLAANVIDRLGGVAAWGSSSHFLTGGHAYGNGEWVARVLFGGRTLGEAVIAGGGLPSGILFGDPLYRPVGVRLHPVVVDGASLGGVPDVPVPSEALDGLVVTAIRGSGTRWAIETCASHDLTSCEWATVSSGVGNVEAAAISFAELDEGVIRLRVESDAGVTPLYDYLYVGDTP